MRDWTGRCALVLAAAAVPACGRVGEDGRTQPAGDAARGPAAGFVDVARESGVTFRMEFLPGEQGDAFKINLYDHGCGLALADVDGDGDDDVYLLNQLGPNALYRNDGGWRFTDVTAQSGVALGDRVCVAAAFGDTDGDGDQDLYVTSTRGGNAFFRNEGGGRFTDATGEAGVGLVAHSAGTTFLDYDGDGDLDLFVANTARWTLDTVGPGGRYHEGPSGLFELFRNAVEHDVLYRNDGGNRFTDVTAAAGVSGVGWSFDTATFDYDEDGRPDLFVANMFGGNRLYHNRGDGTFEEVTRAVLGGTSWGTTGAKAFDYDGDGRLDLMTVDMHSDMWIPITPAQTEIDEHRKYASILGPKVERGLATPEEVAGVRDLFRPPLDAIYGNGLHRNLGGGRFEEVSDRAGTETWWPWGIAPADFDCDGDQDVFLPSGMGYPLWYWRSYFLVNRGDGTFEDRARDVGIDPPPGGLYLDQMIKGLLNPRSQRAAAVSDLDADGRPDLVVVNFNERPWLLKNAFPARAWTGFRLTGTKGNRDAIGALVTLRAGGKVQVRQVESAGGYLAQSTRTLHFGLGDAARVESCEIRWPGGRVQKVDAVKLNAVNEVTEPRD